MCSHYRLAPSPRPAPFPLVTPFRSLRPTGPDWIGRWGSRTGPTASGLRFETTPIQAPTPIPACRSRSEASRRANGGMLFGDSGQHLMGFLKNVVVYCCNSGTVLIDP